MTGSAKYALPEHWTELNAARVHRQQCVDRVNTVKEACAAECGKRHVSDCPGCFAKMLDTMRARYCDEEDREWFSQRRAFLNELDMLFADAKEHKIDLKFIEDQIDSEKEAWYRWVLRMYPMFLTAGDGGADYDELRGMLDDPDRSRQELIERVWERVGKPARWSSDVDAIVDKMASAQSDVTELKKLYISYLFKDRSTGEVLEHAQKYLDAYEASSTMSLEEVVDRIAQDYRASMNTQPQRDTHKARLDELRRAKMAFEQNRLQAKSRSQATQVTSAVAEDLYDLPPCAVCEGPVDPKDVRSCSLCQVMTQIGGPKRLTVYCSPECHHRGQSEHIEREHDCAGGDDCVQNRDEDVEMDDGVQQTLICNECVTAKQASIYCSERCATENLPRHREGEHGLKTTAGEVKTFVSPLWEFVGKALREGNPGLKLAAVRPVGASPVLSQRRAFGRIKIVIDGPHRQQQQQQHPGPSKTFTIDFDVPTLQHVDDNFDALRDNHEHIIAAMFPASAEDDDASDSFASNDFTGGFPTPPSTASHSIESLHAKPQFNVDSATSLLASFRGMLGHFPCVVLRPEETVASLAATRPFVLLAILASASGSRTLQGHTLYDEEFRKVLGLKFVAGGERSLELLQGMLIYIAWYPFHLRPKNKQAFQYVRMAGDLTRDLELDQEMPDPTSPDAPSDQVEKIRTYLAWYYAVSQYVALPFAFSHLLTTISSFMTAWKKMDELVAPFTSWTARCCDALQRCAEVDGDYALTYLARLASFSNAANTAIHDNRGAGQQQSQLVLLGLELQHRELLQGMLPHHANSVAVKLAQLFFSVYLNGGCLLRLGRSKTAPPGYVRPTAEKLRLCVSSLKALFGFITGIGQSSFILFTIVDWSKLILAVILASQLSFAVTEVPDWDESWARGELGFEAFLSHMCGGDGDDLTPANTRVDVLSASRVVLRVVKDKYERRLALQAKAAADRSTRGCPMFDRSMEPFITAWDANFDISPAGPPPRPARDVGGQPVFHDLWATMTLGWAGEKPDE
ncbi:hypothetical protein EDB81DRAFT_706887 [Dactylonectria macrodidyma]|uniref:Uncharacterized protein n=1 Tax=Dactylonectria macrodidyma TaxID=307937 RepID=A0A9P9JJ08_9HYPO|nr:hypothetical protein EDB81DRAFT_706887 [Dactylonectria macrodidyma]